MTSTSVMINLKIASRMGDAELSEIEWRLGPPVELRFSCQRFGELRFSDNDLFGALSKLRLRLELEGYFLLCNVARKDAYPSRMAREMGAGRKIYIFRKGLQAKREDLADAFGEATLEQVGTVAEQREAYEAWIRSLG